VPVACGLFYRHGLREGTVGVLAGDGEPRLKYKIEPTNIKVGRYGEVMVMEGAAAGDELTEVRDVADVNAAR